MSSIPLSVLDVVPVRRGTSATEALHESVALARHVEGLGFHRYWFAEHHGMPGIASSAPAVMIGQVAAATKTMRVGSGGVMLPNHAPLAIAEQFGTLEALFPGRIDLGVGRAPGTDQTTVAALRRNVRAGEDLAEQLAELWSFFRGTFPAGHPYAPIQAVPALGHEPPVWILGSSDYGARLAAKLALPFAFAHHFAPRNTLAVLEIYRETYRPTAARPQPESMIGAIVVVADTDAEARRLALPNALAFLNLRRGRPGAYPTIEDAENHPWTADEKVFAEQWLAGNVVGSPASVRTQLAELIADTGVEELMVLCAVPDPVARQRSYTLLRDVHG